MTIPSRPAPPPPQQLTSRQNGGGSHITIQLPSTPIPPIENSLPRYSEVVSSENPIFSNEKSTVSNRARFPTIPNRSKKVPPPRPPPPKIKATTSQGDTVLKKPGPPQSINVFSNIFGKKRNGTIKRQALSFSKANQQMNPTGSSLSKQASQSTQDGEVQLISFDSPPSSPTLTQKSNSDCVSIDSFSSDSNFSSPNNGSVSQTESGFEDDFCNPLDPWEAVSGDPLWSSNKQLLNDLKITQPVRNLHSINKIQPDDILNNGKSLLPPAPTLAMPTIIKPKASSNMCNSSPAEVLLPSETARVSCFKKSDSEESAEYFDGYLPSPPMPSCPPPPLPSVDIKGTLPIEPQHLEFVQLYEEDGAERSPSYGIALYDFDGGEDGDLSFKKNEKIYLIQRLNREWYLGRKKNGCEGIFPANYIEVNVNLKESVEPRSFETSMSTSQNQVRAIYKFTPETPEDLELNENDLVDVLYKINEDWLHGRIGDRQGQFPANFVEYVPENLPQIR